MELEALEAAADAADISVPETIESRIKAAIAADETISQGTSDRPPFYVAIVTAAAALAIFAIVQGRGDDRLKDTYDDPRLAYAELERTLLKISEKMEIGVDFTQKAVEIADKPGKIINKIYE